LGNDDENALLLKVDALIRLNDLRESIRKVEAASQIELYKVRYRKGIELIKMIYEKY
jgi:hypothetical protein